MFELGTSEHWWDIAKRYPVLSNRPNTLKPLGYAFMIELIETFKPKTVLEAGHGGGSYLFKIFKNELEMWGVDDEIKNNSVSVDQLNNTRIENPEVKFVKGFLGNKLKELPDNYFDLVYSVSVVEHIPEAALSSVFEDVYRILKPGGITAHSYDVYYGQNTKPMFDAIEHAKLNWLKPKDTMNVFWEDWLSSNGSGNSTRVFEKVITENPIFVAEVYLWKQERAKRQAQRNFFSVLIAARKPLPKSNVSSVSEVEKVEPENFNNFTYSKKKHFDLFSKNEYDTELYKQKIDPEYSNLKVYQELLVYSFIKQNIKKGSRILEIDGEDSIILNNLKNSYECWNIGNAVNESSKDKVNEVISVKDSIGNFSNKLPDNHFDFIFSISSLNKIQSDNDKTYENILNDINRVLKTRGFTLVTLILLWTETNRMWTSEILHYFYENQKGINDYIPFLKILTDPELYIMSEKYYSDHWQQSTGKPFRKYGKPISYNLLWRKEKEDI